MDARRPRLGYLVALCCVLLLPVAIAKIKDFAHNAVAKRKDFMCYSTATP